VIPAGANTGDEMRVWIIAACTLAGLFAAGGLSAQSQQDDGPILRPKQAPVKQSTATLHVMCDLACNWKLDGAAQGLINPGGSGSAKVELGEHLVVATTVDGIDEVEEPAKVQAKRQSTVTIQLQPVRDARLQAERDARKEEELKNREAAQQAQEQAAKDQEAKAQKERDRAALMEIERKAESLYQESRYTEATPLLQASCTSDVVIACQKLGSIYEDGKGVAKDYSRAFALYSKSCDAGDANGCNSLGVMYDIGRGVAKDDTKAATLYSKACDAGSADGCSGIGTMYEAGRGVGTNVGDADCTSICYMAKDYPRALTSYSKGCDAGSVDGCFHLGAMYSFGYGVTEDDSMALTLFTRACNGGSARGCYVTGIYYRKGNYVPKDKSKAQQFLSRGCTLGSDLACDALKKMR